MAKKLKVTLIRSGINRPEQHKRTIRALGLRKMHQSAVLPDNDRLRDLISRASDRLTIIGEETHARISGEFETRELDWIRVKGKERPVAIYELAAAAGDLDDERRAVFAHYADGLAFLKVAETRTWSADAPFAVVNRHYGGPQLICLDERAVRKAKSTSTSTAANSWTARGSPTTGS